MTDPVASNLRQNQLFGVASWEVAYFGELALFNYFASNLSQNLLFGVASWEVAFFGELALQNQHFFEHLVEE